MALLRPVEADDRAEGLARAVGISVPTTFYWRHKILTALGKLPKPTLTGLVEADETFFLES